MTLRKVDCVGRGCFGGDGGGVGAGDGAADGASEMLFLGRAEAGAEDGDGDGEDARPVRTGATEGVVVRALRGATAADDGAADGARFRTSDCSFLPGCFEPDVILVRDALT